MTDKPQKVYNITKENASEIGKLTVGIPRKRHHFRDVASAVLKYISEKDIKARLPQELNDDKAVQFSYLVLGQLFRIAIRENKKKTKVDCPECENKFEVEITDTSEERNSIQASTIIMDRMFSKLHSISGDINIHEDMNAMNQKILSLVNEFIPKDQMPKFLERMNELFSQEE